MAKQDDYIRLTIRLPKDIHAELERMAGPRSLNAEIVERLSDSIYTEDRKNRMREFAYGDDPAGLAPGNNPQEKVAALIERIKFDAERVALLSDLFLIKNDGTDSDDGNPD